jgi:hypothetical protein
MYLKVELVGGEIKYIDIKVKGFKSINKVIWMALDMGKIELAPRFLFQAVADKLKVDFNSVKTVCAVSYGEWFHVTNGGVW